MGYSKKAIRKMHVKNDTLAISIPKDMLEYMGLKRGNKVELKILDFFRGHFDEREDQVIIIKKLRE